MIENLISDGADTGRLLDIARRWADGKVHIDDVSGAGGDAGVLAAVVDAAKRRSESGGERPTLSQIPASGLVPVRAIPALESLSDKALDSLFLAALCEGTFTAAHLLCGSELSPISVADDLVAAERSGLLKASGDGWRFAVPWTREILASSRSIGEQRARHYAMARGAMAEASNLSDVVHHLFASGELGATSVNWLLRTARDWMPEDPPFAIAMLEKLAEKLPSASPLSGEVYSSLARALVTAGRAAEVTQLVEGTLDQGVRDQEQVDLFIHLSEALLLEDRVVESIRALENLDSNIEGALQPRQVNQVMAVRSLHRVLAGDIAAGEAEARIAQRTGTEIDDPLGVSIALSSLAHVAYYRGDVQQAATFACEAEQLAHETMSDEARRRSRYEQGMFLLHADRIDDSRSVFEQELRRHEKITSAWHLPLPHVGLGLLSFQTGAWDNAIDHLTEAVDLGEQVSTRWELSAARSHLAVMAVQQGDSMRALRHLGEIDDLDSDTPHHSQDVQLWARALLEQAVGDEEAAFSLLRAAADLIARYGVVIRYRWLAPDLVRLARRQGRLSEVKEVVEALEGVAERAATPYVTGAALRSRALLEGDPDLAEEAVAVLAESARVVDLAGAYADAGRLCMAKGLPGRAIPLLQSAKREYEGMSASQQIARLRSELRALGVRDRPRRSLRPTSGWQSLTVSERRVVELVTQGLTNAEVGEELFISPRTVETHLTRIYAKLGVRSRVTLAALAASRAW